MCQHIRHGLNGGTYVGRNWQSKLINEINRFLATLLEHRVEKRVNSPLDVRAHRLNMLAGEKWLNHAPEREIIRLDPHLVTKDARRFSPLLHVLWRIHIDKGWLVPSRSLPTGAQLRETRTCTLLNEGQNSPISELD